MVVDMVADINKLILMRDDSGWWLILFISTIYLYPSSLVITTLSIIVITCHCQLFSLPLENIGINDHY